MTLFNLIFPKDASNIVRNFSTDPKLLSASVTNSSHRTQGCLPLAYTLKSTDSLFENKKSLAKKKIERKSFSQDPLNTFWSQNIFLSVNSKDLNKYSLKLNYLNRNQGHNLQKSLLSRFSKSLFNGSIEVSPVNYMYSSQNMSSVVQYSWAKNLQSYYLKFSHLFHNGSLNKKMDGIKNILDQKIDLSYLPLFAISNHLGQMIISEPPTDLITDKYAKPYSLTEKHKSNLYHGFFFTNYMDAKEYLHSIQKAYSLNDGHLRILTCNFSTLYKTISSFDNYICFRLIPDLKEIGELMKKYRYLRNVSIHKEQKYGKNYFQGQPLYIIQDQDINSFFCKNYKLTQDYKFAFLNYNDAKQVLNQLVNNNLNKKLKENIFSVYNLESFIQDQVTFKNKSSSPFLIIPSKQSYLSTKKTHLQKSNNVFSNNYSDKVSLIALWSKRIVWSLTSKKPSIHFDVY